MATYYIDLNGGDDANDGLSFANRKKTFDGLISDNDDSSNQNDHIGDEFRVMETPVVNTGLNATWTSGGIYNDNADGTSNGWVSINNVTGNSPIQVTTGSNHGYVTGDIIFIRQVRGVPSANGSWIITVVDSTNFTLNNSNGYGNTYESATDYAFKVTHKGIKVNTGCKSLFGSSGTTPSYNSTYDNDASRNLRGVASANATINIRSWFGVSSNFQLSIGNSFGTGKAWYYTLPETMDLSAYQRISLEFHNRNNTDTNTSHISLKLCTDTTGDVAAHSFSISGHGGHARNSEVHDFGTNLNSAIKSIAIYIDTDVGAEDLRFSNIIAVKDANDGITHGDVIGKNTTAEPVWWNMHYIESDHMLFGESSHHSTDAMQLISHQNYAVYCGTGETVPLYKITPFSWYKTGEDYDNTKYSKLSIRLRYDSRTALAADPTLETKISGGWNTTDMSTRTGVTWQNIGHPTRIYFQNTSNGNIQKFSFENFGLMGCTRIANLIGAFASIKNIYKAGYNNSNEIYLNQYRSKRDLVIDGLFVTGAYHSGVAVQHYGGDPHTVGFRIKNYHLYGSTGNYYAPQDSDVMIEKATLRGVFYPFKVSNSPRGTIYIKELDLVGAYALYGPTPVMVHKANLSRLHTEYFPDSINYFGSPSQNVYSLGNVNGNADDHRIYMANGCAKTETTVRHGTGGVAWKIQPSLEYSGNATGIPLYNTDQNPLAIGIANLYCQANKLVTVKAYLRRTNTALTARLAVRMVRHTNNFVLAADATAACTASADTWQEVTLTFTPTEKGVVGVDFEAFGGNSHTGYIDDVSITQAV